MKTALITGGNRGLGFETARQLSSRGFHVVIGARSERGGAKALVEKTCSSGCHSIEVVTSQRMSADAWSAVVQTMVARGAKASDGEAKVIVDYLAKTLGR